MRMLRYLFAIALISTLSGVAHADDFQMVVIDPIVPLYLIQPVYTDDFSLTFPTTGPHAGCKPSQLNGIPVSQQSGFDACFTGINLTGAPLTSLQIELPTFTLPNQSSTDTPACPTFTSDEFSSISCVINSTDTDYLLDFSVGSIPTATWFNSFCFFNPFSNSNVDCDSPAIFTIAIGFPDTGLTEQQIDQVIDTDVNTGITADANLVAPEPSSLLLLSTGFFSLGLFGVFRRRQILSLARPSPPSDPC
jgi:hypothetical protein